MARNQLGGAALRFIVALAVLIAALFTWRVVPAPEWLRLEKPLPTLSPLESPGGTTVPVGTLPPSITPGQESVPVTAPVSTVESAVTPSSAATLSISAISSDISASLTPVNISEEFPAGTQRLYYWLAFNNMEDGLSWSQVLLRDGTVVRSEASAWAEGSSGTSYFFFVTQGGWPGGAYEIQFYVGDRLIASATYSVVD
jgi:hypothetical protein